MLLVVMANDTGLWAPIHNWEPCFKQNNEVEFFILKSENSWSAEKKHDKNNAVRCALMLATTRYHIISVSP